MRHALIVWLVLLSGVAVAAQDPPPLTAEQRVIIELNNELERLANDLQAALEQEAALQVRFNTLTRAYNTLRLSMVREQSTPTVEGYIFDWTVDPDTGQRRGLVPVAEEPDP